MRLLIILTPLLLLVLVAYACKDDSGSPTTPGPGDETPIVGQTPAAGETPANGETPGAGETPNAGGMVTTDTTPPADGLVGTPVAILTDVNQFLLAIGDRELVRELCVSYDPATGVADCREMGVFRTNPLPPEDAVCGVLLVEGEIIGISCTSATEMNVNIYTLTR